MRPAHVRDQGEKDHQPPLTSDNNEQMLSELGKKYWVPPTRATLAGAAWLPRGAAGTGLVMVGFTGLWLCWCAQTFSELAPRAAIKSCASSHPSMFQKKNVDSNREVRQ